jgi:hypothetical protein
MMKLVSLISAVLLAASGLETLAVPQPDQLNRARPGPHPTRLMAKLKPEIDAPARAAALVSQHGLEVRKQFRHSPSLLLLDETAAQAQAAA